MTDDRQFPQTRWTLVQVAGDPQTMSSRPALEELLTRYLPALRAHLVYRRRIKPDVADDLLHGFIEKRVLEKHLLGKADRTRGKFRTFLLTSLDRFVSNEQRKQRAKIRGGGQVRSLDDEPLLQPSGEQSPADTFDVEWARQIIREAVARMKVACEQSDRHQLWTLFDLRILSPALDGKPVPSYQSLVEQFGFETPSQACNALVTAKRMFARALREVVGEYTEQREQVDGEITDLYEILARCGAGSMDS
jgi:RNA polymerase sigma-70 factor (ECF subfamily)